MDALKFDSQRDFVTRQYANLVADGLNEATARARLQDVLGQAALDVLGGGSTQGAEGIPADADIAARVADAAQRLGASTAEAQAALIHSLGEARLFALDWWRPIRTFLLYILFLLALAVVVAIIYAIGVLPAFGRLDAGMGVEHGAAAWILHDGALRLFAPLAVMAIVLALLASRWWRMRQRMARLAPLPDADRFRWWHGQAGEAYRVLACLEYAAVLKAAGASDGAVLEPALEIVGWPAGKPLARNGTRLGEQLEQAQRLGTFAAELEWQRRLAWSTAQAQLELSRDRLMLFARVVFYILIGIMVTVLYLPIFSMASMFGVH